MTTAYLPDVGTRASNSTASGTSVVDAAPEKWRLTREGFNKFLSVLDTDREASARKYELLRSKLITYFDWRDCPFPEDHADDALNRVVRKLDAGEDIRDVSTYVFGIARMMLLEIARVSKRERLAFTQLPTAASEDSVPDENEQRIECLKECLAALPERSRELLAAARDPITGRDRDEGGFERVENSNLSSARQARRMHGPLSTRKGHLSVLRDEEQE